MNRASDPLYWPVYWAVVLIWVAYGAAFLARKRPPKVEQRARRNRSLAGIALVALGFGLSWGVRRPVNTALLGAHHGVSYVVEGLAVAIAVASVWLTLASIRTLGKQWNLRAALVDDHKLITSGPYGHVRHPIYVGMLGMMAATGMAGATWYAVLVGLAVGLAGTMVRIHYEERLLLEAFGPEFEDYRRRVPALLPRVGPV